MQIFIDESGAFSGFDRLNPPALAAVGALCIPDASMSKLTQKYSALRRRLPKERGEVKGRMLQECDVAAVANLLQKNQAVLEVTIVDVGAHSKDGVLNYRDRLADEMMNRRSRFSASAQVVVDDAIAQIRKSSAPLFLQAIATMDVLEQVVSHIPLYFSQRQPAELGAFKWVVDGKDRHGTTDWEKWWSTYCQGVLSVRSKLRPGPVLEGADYSYFDRAFGVQRGSEEGTDLSLLMSDFRFSSEPELGLELVDIVTNALRRALTGNLTAEGWMDLRRIMIHRNRHYLGLMTLEGAAGSVVEPPYADVVRCFTSGGRNMLAPRFLNELEREDWLEMTERK